MTSALLILLLQLPGQGDVQVELSIRDATSGAPIPYVDVAVAVSEDTSHARPRVADQNGATRFVAPVGATVQLDVTALGYEPWTLTMVVDGPVAPVTVWMSPRPIELEGVSATAERTDRALTRLGFFYARERRGAGTFLGPDLFEALNATTATDVLRRDLSVRMFRGEPVFNRGGTGFSSTCLPRLVLDGVVVREASRNALDPLPRLDDLAPVRDIAAIESYPTGIGAPPEYAGGGLACGVILVWTKR